MRLRRITTGFAQGPPLPQQVPALIQLDLHVGEPFAALRRQRPLLEKAVLFRDQALNVIEYGLVLGRFFHEIPRC